MLAVLTYKLLVAHIIKQKWSFITYLHDGLSLGCLFFNIESQEYLRAYSFLGSEKWFILWQAAYISFKKTLALDLDPFLDPWLFDHTIANNALRLYFLFW